MTPCKPSYADTVVGRSPSGRAGGPSDLSRSASQPKALIPSAAHTPGPWQTGHLGTEVLWIGPDYNQTPVAHVDHDMEYARDNSLANARLIAAAPDMLAALEQIAATAPQSDPGPARDDDGGWNSYGNYDDVAYDARREVEWAHAEIARTAFAMAVQS